MRAATVEKTELTILRNTTKNHWRKRKRKPVSDFSEEILASTAAPGADGRTGPQEIVLDDMLDPPLVAALRALSDEHRAVVLLVDVDGLSYQESADALGIPVRNGHEPPAPGPQPPARPVTGWRLLARRCIMRLPWRRHEAGELDCREVARVMQRYLDDELNQPTARMVAHHLDDCHRCGLEAETYRELKQRLSGLTPRVQTEAVDRLREFVEGLSENVDA